MSTVFEKIIHGELPAEKIFETDNVLVIKDIYPIAPVHLLIISKKVIPNLQAVSTEDLPLMGEMIAVAQKMAAQFGVENAYRLIINNGAPAGQTIFHLHFHLMGGNSFGSMG